MVSEGPGTDPAPQRWLAALAARAQRLHVPLTATAHGRPAHMVWHVWQPAPSSLPVVLLHGGSGSWTHWCRNVDALLAAGRSVWVPDLPGFGDSDALDGVHDVDGLVAPLAEAIGRLLPAQTPDLVGFSFGAMLAGLLAARGVALRSLCLVGAPALGLPMRRLPPLRPWQGRDAAGARAAHWHNLRVLMLSTDEAVDELALHVQATNLARDRLRRRRLSRTDLLARALPDVTVPVHGIWGERDALYERIDDGFERVLALAPRGAGVGRIAASGHWTGYETPAAFDAALAAWLQRAG